jgi:hypothetical protein
MAVPPYMLVSALQFLMRKWQQSNVMEIEDIHVVEIPMQRSPGW